MNYNGQSPDGGAIATITGEKVGLIFTERDRKLAQLALNNDTNAEKATIRMVDLATAGSYEDPHSSMYYLNKLNIAHPDVVEPYKERLAQAGLSVDIIE